MDTDHNVEVRSGDGDTRPGTRQGRSDRRGDADPGANRGRHRPWCAPLSTLRDACTRVGRAYSGEADRPLAGYLGALATYSALVAAAVVVGRKRGARLPERIPPADVVLLAIATHKGSRLLTKSSVASAVRAPFTRYEKPAGLAEVVESAAGTGVRHSVGELVSCPFCSGVWIAGGLSAGLVLAPRGTRLVASALAAVAGSDWLQIGYDAAKQRLEG